MNKNGTRSIIKKIFENGASETREARTMGIAYIYTRD